MIRSIRLTDFVALVSFTSRAFLNEAKSRYGFEGRERGASSLATFFEQWLSLERHRHTWIYVQDRKIRGLVSVRSCAGPPAWEIDRLLLAGDNGSRDTCFDLLSYLSVVGGEVGVQKVFLRLSTASPLLRVTREVGFSHYLSEFLYRREGKPVVAQPVRLLPSFRPKSKGDDMGLFQLYNAAVPDCVRRVEAMTLQEWRGTRERGQRKRRTKDFVLEKEGSLVGWLGLYAEGRVGHFDVMVHPREEGCLDALVEAGLASLRGKSPIYCLVPEYTGRFGRLLDEYGFKEEGEYSTLVKQLAARVRQPHFVLARV